MKRFIWWFLFKTKLGDRLLASVERAVGLAIAPVEIVDETASTLLAECITAEPMATQAISAGRVIE